jgi:hypothetical protein
MRFHGSPPTEILAFRDKEGEAVMRAGPGTRLRVAFDTLIAVAAVLTIVAPRWPWFNATLLPLWPNDGDGPPMAPQGVATGLYAHGSLRVAAGVAAVQLALLLARHYPGGRLQVPGDGILLAIGSSLVCLIVVADAVFLPGRWIDILSVNGGVPFPWEGKPVTEGGDTLVMTWSYGASVAVAAALASLALTMASPVAWSARTSRVLAAPGPNTVR